MVLFVPIFGFGLLKLLPFKPLKALTNQIMVKLTSCWIWFNTYFAKFTRSLKWKVNGELNLLCERSYLVISNHQSWLDIVVLQTILHGKLPSMKFFIKDQLKWVPLLGLTWWLLDFPFMKRYSKAYLAKHPEKKGQDLATTKQACQRFKHSPVTFTNFIEGTRFTQAKHALQNSPYKHLLRPKAGGIAYVLQSMGEKINTIIDVTIMYPTKSTTLWDYLCGRIETIEVYVRQLAIPQHFLQMNYFEDTEAKEKFQNWLNQTWHEKDKLFESRAQRPCLNEP